MSTLLSKCVKVARLELLAGKNEADSFRHWSFVVQHNRILEWGRNKLNDPDGFQRYGYKNNRHSMHAEAVALRKAYGLLDRRTPWLMVNIRLDATGGLRISEPCPICRSFISACGCTTCCFSITDGFAKTNL